MKVYLLRHYDYELQEVRGVYATREAAEAAMNPPDSAFKVTFSPLDVGYPPYWFAEFDMGNTGFYESSDYSEADAIQNVRSDMSSHLSVEEWEVQD